MERAEPFKIWEVLLYGTSAARRIAKKVYVYYWDKTARKLRQLPRAETSILDFLSDDEVDDWVRQWEKDSGREKAKIERITLSKRSRLSLLWEGFLERQQTDGALRPGSLRATDEHFQNHILPFFVGKHCVKDPAKWHRLVPGFLAWLHKTRKLKPLSRKKVAQVLQHFGKFLVYSSVMPYNYTIMSPKAPNYKVTPLKTKLTPKEVLAAVRTHSFERQTRRDNPPNLKLAVLLAYFGSLGPGEFWALNKSDLLGGKRGAERSKTFKDMKKNKLGSKLSIRINKTIPEKGIVPVAKNEFRLGYVTIFDPAAAKAIAEIVIALPEGRLFPFSRSYLDRAWRDTVYPVLKVTAHEAARLGIMARKEKKATASIGSRTPAPFRD